MNLEFQKYINVIRVEITFFIDQQYLWIFYEQAFNMIIQWIARIPVNDNEFKFVILRNL